MFAPPHFRVVPMYFQTFIHLLSLVICLFIYSLFLIRRSGRIRRTLSGFAHATGSGPYTRWGVENGSFYGN